MIDVKKLIAKIALHMPITKKEMAYAILYFNNIAADLCQCTLIDGD